jgi:hypothetical protein
MEMDSNLFASAKGGNYEPDEHDQVVAARVKQLELLYRVLADPDIIRSEDTNGLYPDIIVMDRNNTVLFVEQVETEGSLIERSRNDQWMRYLRLGYPFNLIVPSSQVLKAKQLTEGIKIHKLYFYKLTPSGFGFYQILT